MVRHMIESFQQVREDGRTAVAHSLHAACSQTHRSTPRARRDLSVFLASHILASIRRSLHRIRTMANSSQWAAHLRRLRNEDDPTAQVRPFALALNEHDEVNQGLNSLVWQLVQSLAVPHRSPAPVTTRNWVSTLRIASVGERAARCLLPVYRIASVVRPPHCHAQLGTDWLPCELVHLRCASGRFLLHPNAP